MTKDDLPAAARHGSAPAPLVPRSQRFIAGDPLRGLACAAIVAFHIAAAVIVRGGDPLGTATTAVVKALSLSIYVFFGLSGYLLARPFIAAIHRQGTMPDVRRYAANRVLRIIPTFWVAALLVLLVLGAQGSSAKQVLMVFGFVQTYGESGFSAVLTQAWTLGVEVLFYVALPLVAAAFLIAGKRIALALLLLATAAIIAMRVASGNPIDAGVQPPEMLYAFVPGAGLAALEVLGIGQRLPVWVAYACMVAGLAMIAAHVALGPGHPVIRTLLSTSGASLLIAGPLVLQWRTGRAWRVLDNRVMHYLGERSYPIYLLHVPVILQFTGAYDTHRPWVGLAIVTATAVPLTVLGGEILHRLVERPCMSMKLRWRTA